MTNMTCKRIEEKIKSFLYCSSSVIFVTRIKDFDFASLVLENRMQELRARIMESELMIKEEIQDAYSAKKITWDEFNYLWERVSIESKKLLVCHQMLADEMDKL